MDVGGRATHEQLADGIQRLPLSVKGVIGTHI